MKKYLWAVLAVVGVVLLVWSGVYALQTSEPSELSDGIRQGVDAATAPIRAGLGD